MRTSPGSSVPPTWHRTFGFSGVAPNVTGVRSFSTSTRHRSSAAARQSPGGFVVSIRTYSASRVAGSIVELCPPFRLEFNRSHKSLEKLRDVLGMKSFRRPRKQRDVLGMKSFRRLRGLPAHEKF